jgi:hypothetical protein
MIDHPMPTNREKPIQDEQWHNLKNYNRHLLGNSFILQKTMNKNGTSFYT